MMERKKENEEKEAKEQNQFWVVYPHKLLSGLWQKLIHFFIIKVIKFIGKEVSIAE
jgi:hypothetical protein